MLKFRQFTLRHNLKHDIENDFRDKWFQHMFISGISGPVQDTTGNLSQSIRFHFYDGEGFSNNQHSALVRPFRKTLEKESLLNNVIFVEHEDNNNYFVLGSFTYTEKRILFFPGMNLSLLTPPEYYLKNRKLDFFIDHMSLNRDLRKHHQTDITKEKSKQKLHSQKTKKLTDSLYLWFVWCLKPNVLEKLPRTQSIVIHGNDKEISRKVSKIMDACNPGRLLTTETNNDMKDGHYWNFEFFVHKEHVENDPMLKEFGIHSAYLTNTPNIVKEDRSRVQARIYPLHMDGFEGTIFIRTSEIKGSFPSESLMASGDELP